MGSLRVYLVYYYRGNLLEIYSSEDAAKNAIVVLAAINKENEGNYYMEAWDVVEEGNANSDSGQ